jgi:hypothetical protein
MLNKEETLSALDKVLTCNNPEVNPARKSEHSLLVFILNKNGKPLMPCSFKKSKQLVLEGKAHVIKRSPFTIQLIYGSSGYKQETILGIDTGFGNIGFSARTNKEELISGTVKLDGKTKERLDKKRICRKRKRNRLWYREPRWLNRTKHEGWLPPSIERRYQTHLSLIKKIKNLLPISRVIIETAKFDVQKLENPDIKGKEYQQGDLYEYQNVRSYLMSREKGLCEYCKKDFKNSSSHIHHRKLKSKSGNNRLGNLMLLHEDCHKKIHKNPELLKKYEKISIKEYKQSTFMSIINKRFLNDIKDLEVTYGNITFVNRNKLGLTKNHYNDAFIISGGAAQKRIKPFEIIQKHRNNRVLQTNRKGFKPSMRKRRSIIQPLDLFWVDQVKYSCKGMYGYGKYIRYGDKNKKEYFKIDRIEKYFNNGSLVWDI